MRTKREIVDDLNQLRSDYTSAKQDNSDQKSDKMRACRDRHAALSKELDAYEEAQHQRAKANESDETLANDLDLLEKRAKTAPEGEPRQSRQGASLNDEIVTRSLRNLLQDNTVDPQDEALLRRKYGIDLRGGPVRLEDLPTPSLRSTEDVLSIFTEAGPPPEVKQRLAVPSNIRKRAAGDPIRSDGTDQQGSFFIPPDTRFYRELVMEERAYMGPVGRFARMFRTAHGRDMPITTIDDTPTVFAGAAGDTAQSATQGTAMNAPKEILFGRVTLEAHLQSSGAVPISYQALRDIESSPSLWFFPLIGERVSRRVHFQYANGDGNGDPQGYLHSGIQATALAGGLGTWGRAAGTFATSTAAEARAVAALPRRIAHVLDIAYRGKPNTAIMLNDQVMLDLATAVDTDGKLQHPSLAFMAYDKPSNLGGVKVMVDPNVPNVPTNGAGQVIGVVADWSSYWAREVTGYQIKRDPYTNMNSNEILFYLQKEIDAKLVRPRAMRRLTVTGAA